MGGCSGGTDERRGPAKEWSTSKFDEIKIQLAQILTKRRVKTGTHHDTAAHATHTYTVLTFVSHFQTFSHPLLSCRAVVPCSDNVIIVPVSAATGWNIVHRTVVPPGSISQPLPGAQACRVLLTIVCAVCAVFAVCACACVSCVCGCA